MALEILSVIVTVKEEATIVSVESVSTSDKDIDRENKVARFEDKFRKLCIQEGVELNEIDDCMDDGYAIGNVNVVSMVWS